MGRGEIFRFMPYCSAPSVAVGRCIGCRSVRSSGTCRACGGGGLWRSLLPVRLRHPLPRYIRARHYGMCHVSLLRRTNIQLPPSSSRPQKFSYKLSSRGLKYLERHYWRPLDRLQKVWLHLGVHVISTKGTLVLQMQNTDHRVRLAPRSRGLATRRQVL